MEAFGGNFGRDEGAAWRPFLEVAEVGPAAGDSQRVLDGPAGLVSRLAGELPGRNAEGEIVLPDIRFTADLVDNMLDGEVHQLFLKQFRDAWRTARARPTSRWSRRRARSCGCRTSWWGATPTSRSTSSTATRSARRWA